MQFRMRIPHVPVQQIALAIALAFPLAGIAQKHVDSAPTASQPTSPRTESMPSRAADAKLSSAERKFIEDAAMGGKMEVELGKLALQRSSNDQVRQLAQRIVEDHAQANDRLESLAHEKGVEVPAQLDSKHRKEVDRLQKVSGKDFDRKYAELMVSDHKKDIKEFRHQAERASDPDLREFASMTLPKLETHLSLAENAKKAADEAASSQRHAATSGNQAPSADKSSTQ